MSQGAKGTLDRAPEASGNGADDCPREVIREERSLIAGIRELIGIQELLTVLMVVAAISSAVATWKATQIYARGERPYIGVDSIKLSRDKANRPYVAVNYRNFGPVPSNASVLEGWATVDGKLASLDPLRPDQRKVHLELGVLSPMAPHLFAAYFKPELLPAIVDGKSELRVMITVRYKGPAREDYCYRMDFRYFAPADTFDPAGGSDKCQRRSPPAPP